ncbi:MAG: ribonuclease P protein component 4 [Candidatus Micrarchaeota archaeon]
MNRMDRRSKHTVVTQIAKERIEILFRLARENAKTHPERSKRYIQLARKIGMRYLVRFPRKLKLTFCKACSSPLIPGHNLKIRLNPRHKCVEYACSCGEVKRFPYKHSSKGGCAPHSSGRKA